MKAANVRKILAKLAVPGEVIGRWETMSNHQNRSIVILIVAMTLLNAGLFISSYKEQKLDKEFDARIRLLTERLDRVESAMNLDRVQRSIKKGPGGGHEQSSAEDDQQK